MEILARILLKRNVEKDKLKHWNIPKMWSFFKGLINYYCSLKLLVVEWTEHALKSAKQHPKHEGRHFLSYLYLFSQPSVLAHPLTDAWNHGHLLMNAGLRATSRYLTQLYSSTLVCANRSLLNLTGVSSLSFMGPTLVSKTLLLSFRLFSF